MAKGYDKLERTSLAHGCYQAIEGAITIANGAHSTENFLLQQWHLFTLNTGNEGFWSPITGIPNIGYVSSPTWGLQFIVTLTKWEEHGQDR